MVARVERKMLTEMEKRKATYPKLFEIWSKRPDGLNVVKDIDLRQCATETWKNYSVYLGRAILNNVRWKERLHKELSIAELASGVMKKSATEICGYDFLMSSPPMIPCMISNAAFPMRYAHVLPALMISNFIKATQNEKIDMTVICQGYGCSKEEIWWRDDDEANKGTAETAAQCVVESDVFKAYLVKEVVKPIKRLCIWLLCVKHAFMVVWEHSITHDAIYFVDNTAGQIPDIDAFRGAFLAAFSDRIALHRVSSALIKNLFEKSIFSSSDVEIQPDLVCVSFMARSTAYLNTMDLFFEKEQLRLILDSADVRFQAFCYFEFEHALSVILRDGFISSGSFDGDGNFSSLCVWLPVAMKNKFIDINDICLLVFDPEKKDIVDAMRFEFFFGSVSSFKNVSNGNVPFDINLLQKPKHGGCCVSTEFRPTEQVIGLRAAAAGLRECRGVLGEALASILRK